MLRALTIAAAAGVAAGPALAASGPFFSLGNSDFVVLIAFVVFIGMLLYFRVPGIIGGLLDKRADTVRQELENARRLREEAQTLLAEFERRQKDVQDEAARIVAQAKSDAEAAAAQARKDLKASVARRLQAAETQIASAEANAIREVRNRAAQVAVAAAGVVISQGMTDQDAAAMIEDSLKVIDAKLH